MGFILLWGEIKSKKRSDSNLTNKSDRTDKEKHAHLPCPTIDFVLNVAMK